MIFAAPSVLLALALLPVLWWLLRATPPAPRDQSFPAIRLLAGLKPREETPARTPWWLLALRMAAASLIIIGLARPTLTGGQLSLASSGPILLAIDNGWATAPDWQARIAAANAVLDLAQRSHRDVRLLPTIADTGPTPPRLAAAPASEIRPRLAALRPMPFPARRDLAAASLEGAASGPVFYVAGPDGEPGDEPFARALLATGNVTVLTGSRPARLLSAAASPAGLSARIRMSASGPAHDEAVLAVTGDGRILGRSLIAVKAGETRANGRIDLPPELQNQLSQLVLAGEPGAGSVALLDEQARRRPVGVLGGDSADTALLGNDYYVDRALAPTSELRHGSVASLLARPLSMLIVPDEVLQGADADMVEAWVRRGGLLLRFAGPALSQGASPGAEEEAGERLLPVKLLDGERRLGGAMSWGKPVHLAPFPVESAFSGLAVPAEVTVQRQLLADPAVSPGTTGVPQTWAALADGTPLVTAARLGSGQIVFFHVTANADWSNLPLSGLFVDMLTRLVQRSAGVAGNKDGSAAGGAILRPLQTLDGNGVLGAPPPGVPGATAAQLAKAAISQTLPPGIYGSAQQRLAINLGDHTQLSPWTSIPGAQGLSLEAAPRDTELGQPAVAAAVLLLLADFVATLALRGLLKLGFLHPLLGRLGRRGLQRAVTAAFIVLLYATGLHAAENPALGTHLAYVRTGDADVDAVSKAGLAGLSDYVNSRTAAVLADPVAVAPDRDDLSFYPVVYFPVTTSSSMSPASIAALNDYMRHGGIVLIDLRGGGAEGNGSGAGQAPDATASLRRITKGLDVPALMPLTSSHVLSRAFYLLSDYPGRYDGDTVWVQQAQDRSNDSVSPVIIGSNDWAAAWAQDEDGRPLFALIPGGQRQRTLAFRFGVNLVMYALTGNYKGDQVHVPAILERLGQ